METKRLIWAVVLSVVVIIAYQYFFVKPTPHQAPQQATSASSPQPSTSQNEKKPSLDIQALMGGEDKKEEKQLAVLPSIQNDVSDKIERDYTIDTSLYRAVFTNKGVGLKSFLLKKYSDDQKKHLELISDKALQSGILPFHYESKDTLFNDLNKRLFQTASPQNLVLSKRGDKQTLTFEFSDSSQNVLARKIFVFTNDSYIIGIETTLIQNGRSITDIPLIFGPDLEKPVKKEPAFMQTLKIGAFNGSEVKSLDFASIKTLPTQDQSVEKRKDTIGSGFFWAAYETTYFAAIFKINYRSEISYLTIRQKTDNGKSNNFHYMIVHNPSLIFLGPKDDRVLSQIEKEIPQATRVVEYRWYGGFFGWLAPLVGAISKLLVKLMLWVYGFWPNFGWAIIIATILLKLVLFPLTYSSSASMAKMQTLQPKIKVIRKKYKNARDPEQRRLMNTEIMQLYKEEKVNPAGGCLPILIQIPFFFGFYRALSISIHFRQEPWILWITDLSKKDPLYILPILMAITQIIQQKMAPSGADETQRKLMYIMPVVMLLLFINFPSGLNLYWAVTNVLQIGQQKIINDRIFKKKKDEEKENKLLRRKKGA